MGILFSVVLAVVPPVLFLIWILRFDKYEKEPLGYVIKILVLGCLSVIPAAMIEVPLLELPVFQSGGFSGAALQSFLVIAPVEELAKLLVFFLFVWRNRNFNEINDGIVYAGTISIGFAMAENVFYVLENGVAVGIARAITSIPGHTFTGVIMGYCLGMAKYSGSKKAGYISGAIFIPWFLHSVYDTFALSGTAAVLLIIPMVVFYFVAGKRYLKKGSSLSAEKWLGQPLQEPSPVVKKTGCRRIFGVSLLVVSALFWILVMVGFAQENDTGTLDLPTVLVGAFLITVLPVTAGVLLTVSGKRKNSQVKRESNA